MCIHFLEFLYKYSCFRATILYDRLFFQVFYILQAFGTSAKAMQNRTWSLSNTASNKDCAKNSFWCRVWKGLGVSWASFGRLLGHLGCLLAPLRGFLGASWALLGRSWPSFGWSGALLGRISDPRDAPDPDSPVIHQTLF